MTLDHNPTNEKPFPYEKSFSNRHHCDETTSGGLESSSNFDASLENCESRFTSATSDPFKALTHSRPREFDLLKEVIEGLPTLDNRQVYESTHRLFLAFQRILNVNSNVIESTRCLPPLRFHRLEDSTALIEWIFKDFRVGFTMEQDERESGWYLVSNRNLREASESGLLNMEEIDILLSRLVSFVMSNT